MKNITKILTLLLVLLMLMQSMVVSTFAITPIDTGYDILTAAGQPTTYSKQYNSGTRHVIATTLNGTSADDYYSGSNEYDALSEKSASEILNALRSLMTSTHKKISTYDDCRDMAVNTDCENENGKIILIYTSYEATRSQYNGWNREHVWPKSLGGNSTTGGGADLHHIRPSDASVNSSRGNKKYGNAPSGTAKYGSNPATGYLGGHYNSTYFEPLDEVKGDVARICLYMYVRWGSGWSATDITKVFQSIDVLLEWCELDPVDTWELGRNEVVGAYQGNRNVFIDYPEYAWLIFGREVPDDMVTPSGKAMEDSGSGNNGGSVTPDPDPTPDTHEHTFVNGECACGATDPNYVPDTHEHNFVEGKCECGETDPNYVPPEIEYVPTEAAKSFISAINLLYAGLFEGEEKYNKICEAVIMYNNLTSDDKEYVSSKYELFVNIVKQYNQDVYKVNTDADSIIKRLSGSTIVAVAAVPFAIYSLFGKKYI